MAICHPHALHLRAQWLQLALASRSPDAAWKALLACLDTIPLARTSAAWVRTAGCLLWAVLARLPNRHTLALNLARLWEDAVRLLGVLGAAPPAPSAGGAQPAFSGVFATPSIVVDDEGGDGVQQLLHLATLQGQALPGAPTTAAPLHDRVLESVAKRQKRANTGAGMSDTGSDMEE